MSSQHDPFDLPVVLDVAAPGFGKRRAGADPTARLRLIERYDQDAFERAKILAVGIGAQGYVGAALMRSGIRDIAVCDPDWFDYSNYSRQLGYRGDAGKPKPHVVANNLRREAINPATIRSIWAPFPEALDYIETMPDVVSCLVDDNACRMEVSRWARANGIPAVIAGLGDDAQRWYAFLQEPGEPAACLLCAYPLIEPVRVACGAASIKTVFAVAAQMIHFIEVAILGWRDDAEPYNLREGDFLGRIESRRLIRRQDGCPGCGAP
jgi:molybdopterin/thiamine biosynthesis adenylyltransferase